MMNIIRVGCLMIPFLLAGCESDGEQALVGQWVTPSCEQAKNSEGALVEIWVKGTYEFTAEGVFYAGYTAYADADCTVAQSGKGFSEPFSSFPYQDLGPQLLEEGVKGGGLLITLEHDEAVVPHEAFYAIHHRSLCFSEVFEFGASRFSFSMARSDAIDFNQCLMRAPSRI